MKKVMGGGGGVIFCLLSGHSKTLRYVEKRTLNSKGSHRRVVAKKDRTLTNICIHRTRGCRQPWVVPERHTPTTVRQDVA